MTKEVMKQALNVLLLVEAEMNCEYGVTESLRQAIAEAEKQDEPVAYFNPKEGGFYWAKPTKVEAPVSVDVEPLPLYTTPQTKGCDECGNGGGYALYCLVCSEKFFGKGKEWVGLTDAEKAQFVVTYYPSNWDRKTAVTLMSDYEKYLKEKNT